MWLGGRVSIGCGKNDRGDNHCNPPWHGYCYGSWLPRFHTNGGSIFRDEVFDWGWNWLIFHGWVTIWPKCKNKADSGCAITTVKLVSPEDLRKS